MKEFYYPLASILFPLVAPLFLCLIRKINRKDSWILITLTIASANAVNILLQFVFNIDQVLGLCISIIVSLGFTILYYKIIQKKQIDSKSIICLVMCLVLVVNVSLGFSVLKENEKQKERKAYSSSLSNGTITVPPGVDLLSGTCRKDGHVVAFSVVLRTTVTLDKDAVLLTLPWKSSNRFDFVGSDGTNAVASYLYANSMDVKVNVRALPASNYLFLSGTYTIK